MICIVIAFGIFAQRVIPNSVLPMCLPTRTCPLMHRTQVMDITVEMGITCNLLVVVVNKMTNLRQIYYEFYRKSFTTKTYQSKCELIMMKEYYLHELRDLFLLNTQLVSHVEIT